MCVYLYLGSLILFNYSISNLISNEHSFSGGWRRYQLIPNARVPILKVESNLQNVSCDISIDNLKCQMKSRLLFWISEIDTRFRDMVLLVHCYWRLEFAF